VHCQDERCAWQSVAHRLEDMGAGGGVEACRRLVDEQYVRSGGESPGDVEAALLAAGEVAPADADRRARVEPAAVQQHGGEQVPDVVVVRGGIGEPDVAGDRSGEDVVLGQHCGHDTGSRRRVRRPQRSRDRVQERGLPASRRAGDDDRVARADLEPDLASSERGGAGQPVAGHDQGPAVVAGPQRPGGTGSASRFGARRCKALVGLQREPPRLGGGDQALGVGHHAGGEESEEDERRDVGAALCDRRDREQQRDGGDGADGSGDPCLGCRLVESTALEGVETPRRAVRESIGGAQRRSCDPPVSPTSRSPVTTAPDAT
jgi:hypothetical protein